MMTVDEQSTRVLVVDDDPLATAILVAYLTELDDEFIIETALNFDQALSKVRQNQYALLFTDYMMPGMSGVDLAQAVRRISPKTQIIMLTAYGGSAKLGKTADLLGVVGFLEKPFDVKQIWELVKCTLEDPTRTRRVLILEAKSPSRRLYRQALQDAGYQVCEATSPQEAHDHLSQKEFDVLLYALDASIQYGVNLVREIGAGPKPRVKHIVVISTEGAYRSIFEGMDVDFMETPVEIGFLVKLVDRLTG